MEVIDRNSRARHIVGNNTRTRVPHCSECCKPKSFVVRVGEEPWYESETAYLCKDCIQNAMKLIEGL